MRVTFAKGVVRFRWLIIFITIPLVLLAASGGRFLRFDTDYRIFFSKENPQLLAFEALQETYTKNDNILIVISPKDPASPDALPKDADIFTPSILTAVADITKASWQIPYSIRVDSITNFQHTEAVGDDLEVADLVADPAELSAEELARVRKIALSEPLLVNRLISPTAAVTGVNVTIQLPGKDQTAEVPEVAAFVRAMAQEMREKYPDIAIRLTGLVMMNNAFPEASKGDIASLVPAMFLVVILTLWLLLRSFSATMVTLLVILFSIVTAMGIAGWTGFALSGPSASAPTIILTMAVADCVHLLVTQLLLIRQEGKEKMAAMIESLVINFQPVFLTSLTTAIGFLSMNFSDAPPFRDLGNIVSMGVVAAFFLSVTFLPALMCVLPLRAAPAKTPSSVFMARMGDFVVTSRRGLLWGMLGLAGVLIAFIPANELNDEFVKYFSHNIEFRRATDFSSKHLTGIYQIEYSLTSENGIAEPAFLQDIEKLATWFRAQPEVIHVNTITDIFKRLNRNMHGDDEQWHRLPDNRELAAQYLLLYEMSLPYGLDLNNQINVDKTATRFSVTVDNISSNALLALSQRAEAWMKANLPSHMVAIGASPTVMFAHIGERNIKSMLLGSSIALVLISGVLLLAVRSVKIGLLSLIPNLLPVGMAFGLWGLLVGEVGLGLSVVSGMTLGIVVDDTIHFLSKYLRARREGGRTPQEAVRYAFSTVGSALVVTTVVLMAGFFVLTFSDFKLNSGMGLMTAVTLFIALVVDFLLLPPLLMKVEES